MPPQITRASALPGKAGNTKSAFFTRCVSVLPEFDQLLLDFFNIFDSWRILTLMCDSLNLVQSVQLGAVGGVVQEKGSWERCSSSTVLHAQCMDTNALSSWKKERKCYLWCVWQHLTFVEILRYPNNTVHWLSLQAWRRTTPVFYTATDTVTDLVNIQRAGNRKQDAMLPF